jgi:cyclic pyranopterin phosphate synthase
MPAEGVQWKPHDSMLKFEEILRLCRIMAGMGISKIKVTGGEPLVRRGTASFLKELKALAGIEKVTLTTNGLLLGKFLDEAETISRLSIVDGVNISLDALDEERFRLITRTSGATPKEIIPLIDRLIEKRIPVKINCVPVRGYNEEEIIPLAALARNRNIAVRFIELMPLGSASNFELVKGGETAALLEKEYGELTPFKGIEGNGPAVYYSLPDFTGKVGFINAMSEGFCPSCNRLRLTSEGLLKPCLSDTTALDLRELVRGGALDTEIAASIADTVAKKKRFHTLSSVYGALPENVGHPDGMFDIGG